MDIAVDADVLRDLHLRMVRIRRFEEAAGRMAEAGRLPGMLHLYVGEEAVAAGVCATLRDDDQVSSTHRGHGHLLAKGGDFDRMMAELMGKATGYCNGKGGSMHISDLGLGMLGANGIVGGGIPIAVGAGLANKYAGSDRVSVAFFGDGASNIGAFHEAVNTAAALSLPVIFVCENNEYGEFTPRAQSMAITDVADRAAGYGIPGAVVDGMDVTAVYETASAAVHRARAGDGPSFIEAKTYRFYNHSGVQVLGTKYRTDEELARWRQRDPIDLLEARLTESGIMTEAEIEAVHAEADGQATAAIAFAEESPLPEVDSLLDDVYTATATTGPTPVAPATPAARPGQAPTTGRELTYVRAFNEGLRQIMDEDDRVFVAGEDVGKHGGVFGHYAGLYDQFGSRRLIDTPIAEQAIVGLGIGAAVSGLRPVVDLMFMDFAMVAMDQIVNQAAKLKYMFGGKATVPLTIALNGGAGRSAAAQHSQSLEAMLCHVPGLRVVMPSTPSDVKGLLVSCLRDDNPCIFVSNKMMFGVKGDVPEELYEIPFGSARIARAGDDVTLVTYGRMVPESLAAADVLAGEGLSAEVIDLRSVQPLDIETVVKSVRRTNRVVVVHEAVQFAGLGGEIASQISTHAFDYLDAPVERLGAPFAPVPFSPVLEARYVPNAEQIAERLRSVLARPGLAV